MTEWSYDDEQRAGMLRVDGAATIAQVGQLKEQLVKAIDQAELVLIDLSRVNQIDIAGLQLFCAAHRHAGTHGKALKLNGSGGQFRDLVRAAGFAHGASCGAGEKTPCLWAKLA